MNRLIEDRLGERVRVRAGERAILVGLDLGQRASWQERESMEELIELAQTAKLTVLRTIIQKRDHPDPAYFIGKGKAEELQHVASAAQADLIIMNDALTPAQTRNLEDLTQKKIIDRAQLILNIFAQRARSKEAKLQVELAQLEYLLPRLRGWAEALGQPGAGIATRGPGETRLVQEREAIKRRIHVLKERLLKAEQERAVRRKLRQKNQIPQIALLGYTNTGKSTLLQALTGAETFIEDKLFATLDPVTRRLCLPNGQLAVITDTVGLIKKLPHQLVPAFASTLEAIREADLLLHVLDASSPSLLDHWRTVQEVLRELFGDGPRPPVLHLLNKMDKIALDCEEERQRLAEARLRIPDAVEISARTGMGLALLQERIAHALVRAAPLAA
ncbi:MAG: GTPase HflX [Candidatus Bipolaricaulota bacterium]|nr:GTPase HflX [Candidatus Bipolaricaulota bacterium]MCS7274311.1 GTPase HflX [Candidatus Bipolaricaulota bacterium]MDW8111438.1 GTPase HflX [Candidatus Bipolaricaulota bacterium]MDW8329741.1 GTPase HflX [Candidatus Bipolaricaulota bacterium]